MVVHITSRKKRNLKKNKIGLARRTTQLVASQKGRQAGPRHFVFKLGHSSGSFLGISFSTTRSYSFLFFNATELLASQVCISTCTDLMTTANLLAHTFDGLANTVQTKLCTGAVKLRSPLSRKCWYSASSLEEHYHCSLKTGVKNERGPAESKAENCLDNDARSHQKQL